MARRYPPALPAADAETRQTLRNQFEAVTRLRLRSPLWTAILDAFLAADVMRRGTIGRVQFHAMARAILDRFGNLAQTVFAAGSGSTGAFPYNR